jgi:hypothetical protein
MTAPAVINSGVGLRNVQILAVAADGYPAATSTTAYEGVTVSGAKTLTINDPEPRQIVHTGDDRVFALDVLPPTEPVTGQLAVGKVNDTLDAILSDDKSITVGEAKLFGIGTNTRGDENPVTLLAYRQAVDTDPSSASFGQRHWVFVLIPSATLIRREGNYDENPESRAYTVIPAFVTKHIWGIAFSASTEGFTQAQALRGVSQYKPKLVAYNGDNLTTTFAFPATAPAADTAKVKVWVDGVVTTPSTVATTQFVLATAPTTDANVVVFYEVA